MSKEGLKYHAGGVECFGEVYFDEKSKSKRPAVIVAHAWRGQDDFARDQAKKLAELGYIGFAADLFGNGKIGTTDEEAKKLIEPLVKDRLLLRERIIGAFETIRKNPLVDTSKIGAIGFCFGGLSVIELFKSGTPVRGVVSFHGVLTEPPGIKKGPIAEKLNGSILLLNGHDDPSVSQADLEKFETDMTKAKADWEVNIYGHAMHGFTNPQLHDRSKGLEYNEKAANRAFRSMQNFFTEIFK